MAEVQHVAVVQLQDSDGVIRRCPALHCGSRVHLVLHVAVGGEDVDPIPRNVRMSEDDDVGLREPTAQTGGSTFGRTAVVDGCDFA